MLGLERVGRERRDVDPAEQVMHHRVADENNSGQRLFRRRSQQLPDHSPELSAD